jgi:hypothetical protein
MSNLPNIENATVTVHRTNYWKISANTGYVFWDRADYIDYETGTLREPSPEEIAYSRVGYYPQSIGIEAIEARIVVVQESDVPADQIYGGLTPPSETV